MDSGLWVPSREDPATSTEDGFVKKGKNLMSFTAILFLNALHFTSHHLHICTCKLFKFWLKIKRASPAWQHWFICKQKGRILRKISFTLIFLMKVMMMKMTRMRMRRRECTKKFSRRQFVCFPGKVFYIYFYIFNLLTLKSGTAAPFYVIND